MKKFLVAIAFGLMAIASHAEATFDQVQGLIEQHQYQAAASGLEVIIQNHPKSAKAFYAMAQAQAGLGNQDKAQKALNIATGLNPTLDFAPASSVANLKQAITPQVSKIESIEETHTARNAILFIFVLALGAVGYTAYRRNKEADEAYEATLKAEREAEYARAEAKVKRMQAEREAEEAREKARVTAEAALKAHKNYGHERFDPENPDKLKTVQRMKEEAAEKQRLFLEAAELREAREERVRAEMQAAAAARTYRSSSPAVTQPTHTTVVNNSSNDLLTGVLIGNMLGSSHHDHHDTTIIREREVIRETPSRSSTWDDTPTPSISTSRSSSWDDTPSTKSSSWDDSSSKSSSSWSSSSSDSSSSWSDSSSDSSSSSSDW